MDGWTGGRWTANGGGEFTHFDRGVESTVNQPGHSQHSLPQIKNSLRRIRNSLRRIPNSLRRIRNSPRSIARSFRSSPRFTLLCSKSLLSVQDSDRSVPSPSRCAPHSRRSCSHATRSIPLSPQPGSQPLSRSLPSDRSRTDRGRRRPHDDGSGREKNAFGLCAVGSGRRSGGSRLHRVAACTASVHVIHPLRDLRPFSASSSFRRDGSRRRCVRCIQHPRRFSLSSKGEIAVKLRRDCRTIIVGRHSLGQSHYQLE